MIAKFKDVFLYGIVGGVATLTEWALFYGLNDGLKFHYMWAATLAYISSTFVNWLAGRLIMFKESEKGILKEIFLVYAASVIGLLANLGIMWVMVDVININEMISKMTATVLVFAWNYIIRKRVIYNKKKD